ARSPVRYIRTPAGPNGHATNRPAVSPGCPRYPRASPAPATYNSPITPSGTSPSPPSSTNNPVFAIGRPIGGTRSPFPPGGHAQYVTSTVASVGPYKLPSPAPDAAANRAASPAVRTSPPHTTRRHGP